MPPDDAQDPVAVILADPGTHYADLLYTNFRIYKKRLLWKFFCQAIEDLQKRGKKSVAFCDIGASMGFDFAYLIRKLTGEFSKTMPFESFNCSLIEGDPQRTKNFAPRHKK